VRIEPAGWGTKVILTAVAEGEVWVADAPPVQEPPVEVAAPEPAPTMAEAFSEPELPPPVLKRRWARLKAFWRGVPLSDEPEPPGDVEESSVSVPVEEPLSDVEESSVSVSVEPPPASEEPSSEPGGPPPVASETESALTAALDSLGQAHHRPYSRA
jgi:hypothetical protein